MSIILTLLASSTALPADTVVGRWQTESRHGVVEITRCGQSICGALISSDGIKANPELRDEKNKTAALRGRPLRGLQSDLRGRIVHLPLSSLLTKAKLR